MRRWVLVFGLILMAIGLALGSSAISQDAANGWVTPANAPVEVDTAMVVLLAGLIVSLFTFTDEGFTPNWDAVPITKEEIAEQIARSKRETA